VIGIGIGIRVAPPATGAAANPVSILGPLLVAWWSADRADLMTLAGAQISSWRDVVAGLEFVQGVSGARPVHMPTGFNGAPCAYFDGIDDEMTVSAATLPSAAVAAQMMAVCANDALAADATIRYIAAQGNGISLCRRLRRVAVSGFNRGGTVTGTGAGSVLTAEDTIDLSGRHVLKGIFGATETIAQVNGTSSAPAAVVPATSANRIRIGASDVSTPSNFWSGSARDLLVYLPPTAPQAAALDAWAQSRRNP
jgi:hypothetical protein